MDEDAPESAFLVDKLAFVLDPCRSSSAGRPSASGARSSTRARRERALASKPDVVYWAGSAEGAGRLVAALRRAGFKGIFLASAQSESPAFVAAAGGAARARSSSLLRAPGTCRARGVARRFAAAYGHAPGHDALQAYDAVRALAQAVAQTGEVDHALQHRAASALDLEFTTLLGAGPVRARPHDPGGRPHRPRRPEGRFPDRETPLRSNSG